MSIKPSEIVAGGYYQRGDHVYYIAQINGDKADCVLYDKDGKTYGLGLNSYSIAYLAKWASRRVVPKKSSKYSNMMPPYFKKKYS